MLVYGVLFQDWNTQGTGHVPFEGVGCMNWVGGICANISLADSKLVLRLDRFYLDKRSSKEEEWAG